MSQSRSPQEIRIQNEINHKKIANVHENRATEILKKVRESKPQIDIERGLYFTKSFQKTEGQPLILRWAKALKYYQAEMYHHLILLRKMRRSLQSRSHLTGKGRRFMRILQKHFRGKQKNLLIMEIKS